LKVNWHYRGAFLLPDSCWFLAWLIPWPWRWRRHAPLKCQLTFNGLHSIISQKTELNTVTLLWEPKILQIFVVPCLTKSYYFLSQPSQLLSFMWVRLLHWYELKSNHLNTSGVDLSDQISSRCKWNVKKDITSLLWVIW
jgi:flagellar biosynthesis protein FliQ